MILLRAFGRLWFAVVLAAAAGIVAFAYLDHFMPFDLDRPPERSPDQVANDPRCVLARLRRIDGKSGGF